MDKEEYREEVIKQLKKQNGNLEAIELAMCFILLGIIIIIALEVISMRQLIGIKCDTDSIRSFTLDIKSDVSTIKTDVSTIKTDVHVWLADIFDKVTRIYGYVKWR